MTCRELIEVIDDYLGDELPAGVRAAFEGHEGSCGSCREYLRSYQMTLRLARLLQ